MDRLQCSYQLQQIFFSTHSPVTRWQLEKRFKCSTAMSKQMIEEANVEPCGFLFSTGRKSSNSYVQHWRNIAGSGSDLLGVWLIT
ncbi:hypothetical protein [Nitrosomonas halophila]|uniref:hypothetical protein n=1 Tax=Nitrosomonas halophila TaxID=44576 RepID=UPI0015A3F94D|nr:hypothetical protein [Nitrosomonas halophila]